MHQEGFLMDLAIRNAKFELEVVPGQEARHVLSDDTWPEWDSHDPMVCYMNQLGTRIGCYPDGRSVVLEMAEMDTCFPMPATGFSICCYHKQKMYRIASGTIRRQ